METAPDKECDLIMKGGIASGIVYPQAVLALKEAGYRFRCVGGTSAGAIAATATAAAEFGRETGGFDRLAALSERLCEEKFLRGLFQPSAKTRALMELASTAFGGGPVGRKVVRAGAGVAVGGALARKLLKDVPENAFGICRGHAENPDPEAPALTDWLVSEIEGIGGKPAGAGPLTFGDLERRGVRLRMMTTNVSQGLPFVLPFDKDEFLFCAREMAEFFPRPIVEHLVAKAHKTARVAPPPGFHFLPPAADLPLVVAMRLSLSFPILLSAVPLYTLNFDRPRTPGGLDRSWFSDGGVCSNFPIHFFDTWLPVRPTFGINLTAGGAQTDAVSLPGASENAPRVCHPLRDLAGFLGALVSTMQNYRDNTQARLPSYRERVVQVRLETDEGGLNLDMPAATLAGVARKGALAGRALARGFRMDAHQWTRFQALMCQLEAELKRMDGLLQSGRFDFEALAEKGADLPYARSRRWGRRAGRVLRGIHALVTDWPEAVFQDGSPKPLSDLRLTPCLSRPDEGD